MGDTYEPLHRFELSSPAKNAILYSNVTWYPQRSGFQLRREHVLLAVREAAKLTGSTRFVIVGSQAVHGTIVDPPIATVLQSIDVDLFPLDYREAMFVPMHSELGFESEFYEREDFYVELVRPTLPRFPEGWLERAKAEVAGEVQMRNGQLATAEALFPEIHDLTISKIVIGRAQDDAFLTSVVSLGLVNRETLQQRLRRTPRVAPDRVAAANARITEIFAST